MNKANRAENLSSPDVGATSASVSVVVPTYNEAANLPELARRLFCLGFPNLTLFIVDDSSPDGTVDVALRLSEDYHSSVQVIKRPSKQGLGTAYLTGFARALEDGADFIVQMDADLSARAGGSAQDAPVAGARRRRHRLTLHRGWRRRWGLEPLASVSQLLRQRGYPGHRGSESQRCHLRFQGVPVPQHCARWPWRASGARDSDSRPRSRMPASGRAMR